MGVIGKSLYISEVIAELQGNTSSTYCIRTLLATSRFKSVRYSITVSLSHGELERYIAIKHALRYETIVTEKRLTCLSALLWIILLTITVGTITLSLCITTIIFCQVVLYHETRRHKKEIAAGQFSMEAREKFLREKKAFILTTMILFSLILCYLPFTVARILNTNIKVCHQFSQFSIHSPIYRQNSGSFQLDDQPDHLLCTN
ncbi:unnamed protein product [Porites lobata]|uniref:G-protein coupled receptors family 1 profile domain-containing protein n=1 Tax=Porites lobata TaxID=104759 RepID=A0ABN8NEE3_9CNID|nr:unnamed protein product [Porites lobata]